MTAREKNQLRPFAVTPHYIEHPEGSVLIECGSTHVICTASIDESVPRWMKDSGKGWVTAEYDMLPRATTGRRPRDSYRGKVNGRTQEISRLIGRSLRAIVDLEALGERSVTVDCDVIQADGGTRTTSITGAWIALHLALQRLEEKTEGAVKVADVLKDHLAAISVGVVDGDVFLDLDYDLDSRADVDMNIVMTGNGELAEVQGTGEESTYTRAQLNQMLDYAFEGMPKLVELQKKAIAQPFNRDRVRVVL